MEIVARINPLTYAIDAMRTLVIDGWSIQVLSSLAILTFAAGICLVVGTREFYRQTGDRVRG
jgi:ABC-2 type transport system permease protein